MKTIVITIIAILSFNAFSQSNETMRFYNENSVSFHRGIGKYKTLYSNGYENRLSNLENSFSFSTSNGIRIKEHQLGFDLGIDKWQEALFFPITARYKYTLDYKKNRPFGFIMAGHSFGSKDKTKYNNIETGSFTLRTGGGIHFNLNEKFSIIIDASYKLQAVNTTYVRIINPYETPFPIEYRIYYHFIGISVGIKFI